MVPPRYLKQTGFTIVELLIVIIVIAILATISIVAYNGIQERAKNSQTVSAVSQWAQALRMYKVDNGAYPPQLSCLGVGYSRGLSGEETTGGQCRELSGGSQANIDPTFVSAMNKYISGSPTPAFVNGEADDGSWYRGAIYVYGYTGSKARIDFVLTGSSTECPSISGLAITGRNSYSASNSVRCVARFPDDSN